MKVWGIPVNFPNPDEEPEAAEAAVKFIKAMKGVHGICPHKSGLILIVFPALEDARAAKWKLEEFTDVDLPVIEGNIDDDGKTLNCTKVLKGE